MFETYLIQPLYNAFIYLIGVAPNGDVGLAIIAMTLIIRAVFYPAFTASIRTQMGMQAVQGEVDEINQKYKDNPEEKARRTMQLFKDKKIRPFAGILAILVQIPIFIALYFAFFHEELPNVASNMLYSFVQVPQEINLQFLGFLDLLQSHNIPLAVVVGALQYLVVKVSLMRIKAGPQAKLSSQKAQAMAMQQNLMLYFMPALYAVITYSLPAAAGLYFGVGNLISLVQELVIKRQIEKQN